MARTDNFKNFATDVADSIREMTGETGLIPASEFDTKIKSIETKGDFSLQDKLIEITENGTTNVVADDGYYGLNSVEVVTNVEGGEITKPLYLIENGHEQTDVTGGSELVHDDMGSGITNGVHMSQGTDSLNFYGGLWQAGKFVFNNEINLSKYIYLYIDYAFPSTTNSKWSAEIKFQMIFKNANKTITFHNGGTITRTTVKIPITGLSENDIITLRYQNLGAINGVDNGSEYDPNSPLSIYNMWLDSDDGQDKIVTITENGTTTVLPDNEYKFLNSVVIHTLVEGDGDVVKYSTEEQLIGTWIDERALYRKVLVINSLPNNGTVNVPYNIENLHRIINVNGIAYNGSFGLPLPTAHSTDASNINVYVDYNEAIIGVQTFSDRTSYTEGYLIIEYTKTED